MALLEGQWQIRTLVIGDGTDYRLMHTSNPFDLNVRADQGGARAWNHGSWSGAEWASERVVPMRILVRDEAALTVAGWREARHTLAAAFAPVGDSGEQVELRFNVGGTEYMLFGRPRMVEFDTRLIGTGQSFVNAGFVAQDPRIYSGTESTTQTGLPTQSGGLTVPLTVPFTVDGVLTGGSTALLNEGTTDTGLTLRIDGPVIQPTVVVQQPAGDTQQITFDLDLAAGQFLNISTAARTALLNGLPQANQRGRAIWDIDPYPLQPGTSTLRYLAGGFNATTQITARWRSAYW